MKYKLVITKQSRDVKYSIGTIVNNIAIITHGVRWVLDLSGDYFISYINV